MVAGIPAAAVERLTVLTQDHVDLIEFRHEGEVAVDRGESHRVATLEQSAVDVLCTAKTILFGERPGQRRPLLRSSVPYWHCSSLPT